LSEKFSWRRKEKEEEEEFFSRGNACKRIERSASEKTDTGCNQFFS
jgi:hypothetical protein